MYKIGITERGDASLDFSWVSKLNTVDGAIIITKNITDKFIENVLYNKDKIIIHATCTGLGGSKYEPNIPSVGKQLSSILKLISFGFPKDKIVIRIDPIIPMTYELQLALNTFKLFIDYGFNRFRVSIIDMYPHVRERFIQNNILVNPKKFSPNKSEINEVNSVIELSKIYYKSKYKDNNLRIESCAEPSLYTTINCGCISEYDLQLLGLVDNINSDDFAGFQRKNCKCYNGKVELLSERHPCNYKCLYCYWKN